MTWRREIRENQNKAVQQELFCKGKERTVGSGYRRSEAEKNPGGGGDADAGEENKGVGSEAQDGNWLREGH